MKETIHRTPNDHSGRSIFLSSTRDLPRVPFSTIAFESRPSSDAVAASAPDRTA